MLLSICEFRKSVGKALLFMGLHEITFTRGLRNYDILKAKNALVKSRFIRQVYTAELLPSVLFLSTIHSAVPS
jgi:hypothetical protein